MIQGLNSLRFLVAPRLASTFARHQLSDSGACVTAAQRTRFCWPQVEPTKLDQPMAIGLEKADYPSNLILPAACSILPILTIVTQPV